MKLHDPNFLTFAGEPITGVAPPTLHVYGNAGVLTNGQESGLRQAYKLFRDALRVSLGTYLVQNRVLGDGSLVRMVSNNGLDEVYVWPVSVSSKLTPYADEFFAVPSFYAGGGFPPWSPKYSGMWPFKGKTVTPTSDTMKPTRLIASEAPGIQQHPGNLTWWSEKCKANTKPMIVSWWGRHSRYGRLQYFGVHQNIAIGATAHQILYGTVGLASRTNWKDAFKPAIWLQGVKHAVRLTDDPDTHVHGADVPVMSAGLRKTADGLFLYVVTYQSDNKLGIFRGLIKPYSGTAVQVAKVCDIEFFIDSTTYATANPTNPMWETIVQPVYFNDDCTRAASIVAVDRLTAVNTAATADWPTYPGTVLYFAARLMTVDVEAGTTAFTAEHASVTSSGTTTTTTSQNDSVTRIYGAVDFSGQQMLLAMIEVSSSQALTKDTTGILYYPEATEQHSTETLRTYDTGYRIVFEHNGAVLASRTLAGEVTGTFHVESTSDGSTSNGTGYRTELASGDMLITASIEGGDLRHQAVLVAEYLEVGNENINVTLTGGFGPDYRFTDGFGVVHIETLGTGGAVIGDLISTVTKRKPAGQMSAWKEGTQLDVTTYVADPDKGEQSKFGWNLSQYNYFPGGTSTPDVLLDFFIPSTNPSILAGWDYMGAFATGLTGRRTGGGISGTGKPFATVFASSPDGKAWFYDIGAFYPDSAFEHSWSQFGIPDFDGKAAFVLDGTKNVFDPLDVMGPGYGQPSLASAVFLYQVPEKFK